MGEQTTASSTVEAAKSLLRLVQDVRGRDAIKCVATASYIGVDVDIVAKDTSTGNVQERPLLLTGEGHIFSPYAICKYLHSLSGDGSSFLPTGPEYWEVVQWVGWTTSRLQSALEGANKKAVDDVLDFLEATLSQRAFLVGNQCTMADVFVWSTLYRSRANVASLISLRPALSVYVERVEALAFIQTSIRRMSLPPKRRRIPGEGLEKFFITTAINYTNGPPHIGHAYEAITADVIARYHRMYGRDVHFVTGTDEHGQKIATTAEGRGQQPIELCDFYMEKFENLNSLLHVSNDDFIRTSSDRHRRTAQEAWRKAEAAGDIYLSKYTGWYNVREETFVTERDAEAAGYKDVTTGKPLEKMEEASYFFGMSKYQDALIQHIKAHPEFIQPDFRRNEILTRLSVPLEDLSVSRTAFSWGVPVPNDTKHCMYVWFDALSNYLTAVEYPNGCKMKYWQPDVQIIGKDIIWFHCVIWPTMLMSLGLPLPKTVFAHGFVSASDGRKMSKSFGNAVDPHDALRTFEADSFRFFLVKEAKYGMDMKFDIDAMIDAHNGDLADTLGNLVHRITGLCQKFCDGKVPDVCVPKGEAPFDFEDLAGASEEAYRRLALQEALEEALSACRDTNKYLTDHAPWASNDLEDKQQVIRAVLEAVYAVAHFLEPVLPKAMDDVFKRLGCNPKPIRSLSSWFDNLTPGAPVTSGPVLFAKKQQRQAEIFLQKLELRAARLLRVAPHPKAPQLSVVHASIGEDTGLGAKEEERGRDVKVAVVPIVVDQVKPLEGKMVLVVCNSTPPAVKGVQQTAQFLVAKDLGGNARVLLAGEGVAPGSLMVTPGLMPVLRKNEMVTKQEMEKLHFEKAADGSITFEDTRPLHLGSVPLKDVEGNLPRGRVSFVW